MPAQPAPARSSSKKEVMLAVVVVAVVLVLGLGAYAGARTNALDTPAASTASQTSAENPLADLPRRTEGDHFALGDVDAPVVIVEYADFACPFCSAFAENTVPAIVEKYVDTGQVRIEWRDTPVLGDSSVDAAVAGHVAAEQGRFWDWYHAAFAYTFKGGEDFNRSTILKIAGQIDGLDLKKFTADLDRRDLREAVRNELDEAKALGVSGVPVFVVGDQMLQGAQPLETFTQAIDSQLETKG
ncbi:DsbA family protein [Streptomyces tendae]